MGRALKSEKTDISKPEYRVVNERLISYRELYFTNMKREFVKEIWIGPKAEVELRDIVQVLRRYNYFDTELGYSLKEPIWITKSSSSYR